MITNRENTISGNPILPLEYLVQSAYASTS